MLDPINGYTVRGAYRFITSTGDLVDRNQVDDVWHKHVPSKVSLLAWRLLRNRLPTKDNLAHRGILHSNDTTCVDGCASTESTTHLFLHCNFLGDLWSNVFNWLGISSVPVGELQRHFTRFTKMAGMPFFSHLFFKIIWFTTVWVIWKERNNRIFQNMISTLFTLIEKVKLNSFLWLKSKQVAFAYGYHDWWQHPILCMSVLM